eukprot:scaffold15_cov194-Alexandrium_tamarense.AAC.3
MSRAFIFCEMFSRANSGSHPRCDCTRTRVVGRLSTSKKWETNHLCVNGAIIEKRKLELAAEG